MPTRSTPCRSPQPVAPWRIGVLLAFATALLVGCSTTPRLGEPDAGPAVRYTLDAPEQWPGDLTFPLTSAGPYRHLPVAVNGVPVGRFLLDTGANRPVIDTGRANRLRLPDVGGGTTTGIAGSTRTRHRQADSLRLGPADFPPEWTPEWAEGQTRNPTDPAPTRFVLDTPPARMIALPMRGLSGKFSAGVGGILCFRTLQAVPFTLDPQANTLTLHRPDMFQPPRRTNPTVQRVRLHRFHTLPTVDATLQTAEGPDVPVRLILDTGMNSALALPDRLLRQHPTIASVDAAGHGLSAGIGGTLRSTTTWARNLRVFGLDLPHLSASFEPMPDAIDSDDGLPQGRLGMGVLAHFRLTFDPTAGWLYAEYLGEPRTANALDDAFETTHARTRSLVGHTR